jgi:hypothetical protein
MPDPPSHDPNTEWLDDKLLLDGTHEYTVRPKTTDELTDEADGGFLFELFDPAGLAQQYLDLPSPTNAQSIAAIRKLIQGLRAAVRRAGVADS